MKKVNVVIILAILAIAMLFNVCYAGSGYKDIDGTEYELAVSVLDELELVAGYVDGEFKPNGTVTKAELIKTIINAYGLEKAANMSRDEETGFSDVPLVHWANGYIKIALDYGFIDEPEGNKSFYPDSDITYSEALTYCLRMLGYKNVIEARGTRPTNYIVKALELNLMDDIECDNLESAITRGNWTIMLWNVMQTKVWKRTDNATFGATETFLENKYSKSIVSTVKKIVDNYEESEQLPVDTPPTPPVETNTLPTPPVETNTLPTPPVETNTLPTPPVETNTLPTSIKLESNELTLCMAFDGVHAKSEIDVILQPKNVTDKTIKWSSSDPDVAYVNKNNYIVAKSQGTATIIAETVNGLEASCVVKVIEHDYRATSQFEYNDTEHWNKAMCTYCLQDIDKANVEEHAYVNGVCKCGQEEPKKEIKKLEYEDVNEDDWYEESVKYVTDKKLMNGVGENKFNPTANMTRGMVVTVLYRMSGSSYSSNHNGKSKFLDVNSNEYYFEAVEWASENNIVNGIGNNEFAPNSEITREQLIVILYRYAQFTKTDISIGENNNILSYNDFNEISEYSISAFQWGYDKKIISGRTSTTLSPKETASRAEVATMLMKYLENN